MPQSHSLHTSSLSLYLLYPPCYVTCLYPYPPHAPTTLYPLFLFLIPLQSLYPLISFHSFHTPMPICILYCLMYPSSPTTCTLCHYPHHPMENSCSFYHSLAYCSLLMWVSGMQQCVAQVPCHREMQCKALVCSECCAKCFTGQWDARECSVGMLCAVGHCVRASSLGSVLGTGV